MLEIVIIPGALGSRGLVYSVEYCGETIVESSQDPEYDAARALLARGLTGPFRTMFADGRPRMNFSSIEAAAKLRTREDASGGIRTVKWDPFTARSLLEQRSFDELVRSTSQRLSLNGGPVRPAKHEGLTNGREI